MNKWGKVVVALVVVAVVIGGVLVMMNKKATQTGANKVDQTNQNSTNEETSKPADVTITYDGNNFALSSSSVKSGGTVKIVNNSNEDLQFQSDPHPLHTDNSELNVGSVDPGKSVTITLTKTGTWGFHNHLNHGQHGEITVE